MLEICHFFITVSIASLEHINGDNENSWQKELCFTLASCDSGVRARTESGNHRR
jgi:hypothetical protein